MFRSSSKRELCHINSEEKNGTNIWLSKPVASAQLLNFLAKLSQQPFNFAINSLKELDILYFLSLICH